MATRKTMPEKIAETVAKGADAILKGLDALLPPVGAPRPVPVRVRPRGPVRNRVQRL